MDIRVCGKRLLAYILVVLLSVSPTVSVYADTQPGGSKPPGTYKPGPTNPNYKADYATFKEYGYRLTITTPEPILNESIGQLPEKFTTTDLDQQFEDIAMLSTKLYWEPGQYGLNFYTGNSGTGSAPRFLLDGTTSEVWKAPALRFINSPPNTTLNNPLAFMLWDTPDDWARTPGVPAYNPELYKLFTGEGARAYDSESWFQAIKQYISPDTALNLVQQLMGNGDGNAIAQAFPYFTWSSRSDISDPGNAYQKVLWFRIGLVAADTVVALAAERAGDTFTATKMRDAIYSWVSSDYASSNMAILMVESTQGNNVDGNTDGPVDFVTLPASLELAYPGKGAQEILYRKWPDDVQGDTNKAIVLSSQGEAAQKVGIGALKQGVSGYANQGVWIDGMMSGQPRNYLKTLRPYANVPGAYGYFINWTYWTDELPPPPDRNDNSTKGSFTWKLTPDGVHDKTPNKEVNESSTIYELNISQDKVNHNNYNTEWVPAVRGDNSDCNKLRIRIYHISENLAEEQMATKYARDSVKQKGADG